MTEWLADPAAIGRFLATAFFAVVFGQSAFDKLTDQQGNVAYFTDHFKGSPLPPESIPVLFWVLTVLEGSAAALCAIGLLFGSFAGPGMSAAAAGLLISGVALLGLLLGQRLAKDYAGAAVVAAYFAVLLVGLSLF